MFPFANKRLRFLMARVSLNQSLESFGAENRTRPDRNADATVNVHIYLGPPRFASRVLKITGTLIRRGIFDRIVIIATDGDHGPARESLGLGREAWRVGRRYTGENASALAKGFGILLWSLSVIRALASQDITYVNSHSLSVLPLCVVLKVLKRAKLVYDTHELETETVAAGKVRRIASKLIERSLMGFVDEVSVVNDAIAKWYQGSYNRKVWVVKNVPHQTEAAPVRTYKLRRQLQIGDNELVFLYQGGMSRGRGIHLLLEAFASVPDRHLVFLGNGDLAATVQAYSRKVRNIHHHPAVSPHQLNEYTPDADVGLCTFENVCLNHYLALPNKLFEYLVCGIPVLVSDFPEMCRVVSDLDCGWCSVVELECIRQLVMAINHECICEKRNSIAKNRNKFGWQLEEAVLISMYRQMFVRKLRSETIA
jgi:glycosyltransferase involved in cell wall biosynthesis